MLDLIVLHGEFSLFTVRGNFWYQIYRNRRKKVLCSRLSLITLTIYLILTKLGDIIDRLTRNLSEKFKAYPIIRHYVTAQSNVFCLIFITISTPISTKFFGQL